ncbi:MAG: TetR/AcrR family transcriptional regulator [Desulfobacterales bacterium]|nr:TetR/AcrR family transcriptional regulator [Desulfobacterales bacterium]
MSKKENILNAGTALFAQKGFRDTSTSDIANLTNVADGTIFYHFKTKEALLLAILEKVKIDILNEFKQYTGNKQCDNGIDMVENAIAFYLYLSGKMENQFLLLHRHFPYELAEKNEECREYLEAIYNCLVDIFETAILKGQKDGSIPAEKITRKTALIIFSMVDGVVRFKTYNMYDASALYGELINSCRCILTCKI